MSNASQRFVMMPHHFKVINVQKHQAGTHDQLTHGNWADAIPADAKNTQGLIDRLVKAGVVGVGSGRYAPRKRKQVIYLEEGENAPEGVRVETEFGTRRKFYEVTVMEDKAINNIRNLSRGYLSLSEYYVVEGAIAAGADRETIEKKLNEVSLRANQDTLEAYFYEEAQEKKLGRRLQQYYAQAMAERVSVIANTRQQTFLFELYNKYSGSTIYHQAGAKAVTVRDPSAAELSELAEQSRTIKGELEETQKVLPDLLNRAKPTVAIYGNDMVKVIEDGRFKAQYETRESNGAYKPALRRTREFGMLGVPQDTKAKDRPIYGFITTQETGATPITQDYNSDVFNVNSGGVGQYGGVRVTFKPEVAERTTYTMVDSLDGHALGKPLRDKHTVTSMAEAGLYDNISITTHGGKLRESYFEAQIHGGVSVKDIESIYVTDNFYENTEDRDADVAKIKTALRDKKLDIPVRIIYEDKVEVAKRKFTKSIAKATVLYRNSDGSELLYTKTQDGELMGRVRDKYGRLYPEKSVGTIIARGYWDVVYEVPDTELEKHQRGTHDQESHGDWADGDSVEVKGQGKPVNVVAMKKIYEDNDYTVSKLPKEQRSHLYEYLMGGHEINRAIHRGDPKYYYSSTASDLIKDVDAAIENAPPLNGDFLYRMTRSDEFSRINVGDVIESPAYLSTSANKISSPAHKQFRKNIEQLDPKSDKVFLKITGNAGKSGLVMPAVWAATPEDQILKSENEVLLPRNTQLRVKSRESVRIDGKDTNIYEMERIS